MGTRTKTGSASSRTGNFLIRVLTYHCLPSIDFYIFPHTDQGGPLFLYLAFFAVVLIYELVSYTTFSIVNQLLLNKHYWVICILLLM